MCNESPHRCVLRGVLVRERFVYARGIWDATTDGRWSAYVSRKVGLCDRDCEKDPRLQKIIMLCASTSFRDRLKCMAAEPGQVLGRPRCQLLCVVSCAAYGTPRLWASF